MLKSDCEAGAFCYHKMPLPDKFRTVGRPEKIRGWGTIDQLGSDGPEHHVTTEQHTFSLVLSCFD